MSTSVEPEQGLKLPPLSLYVHFPWCIKKCPYCDFNSHPLREDLPASLYVDALIADLESDLPLVWGRPLRSVFFGGGTPSLFDAEQIDRFLAAVRARLQLVPGAEITLEANPGALEHDAFCAYRDAGVNRVSLGVQSFDDKLLKRIGRIHGRAEVEKAIRSIKDARLENFNLDLMFGLPQQQLEVAVADIREALKHEPPHLSHYQLTVEPNTAFHANPPALPDDEHRWEMQQACEELLLAGGYEQYEISAWARPHRKCAHNLNYWRYGDYLGIGAGAHGKITQPAEGVIRRLCKQRHPRAYMQAMQTGNWRAEDDVVAEREIPFEFFMNQLRLREGVHIEDFGPRTGMQWSCVDPAVSRAQEMGLLEQKEQRLVPTSLGWRFVNETQLLFLPRAPATAIANGPRGY